MPTYPYACTECGHQFEKYQSFHDDPLTECPECGGKLRKVWGSVGVVFKGSGFYRNDSRSGSGSSGSSSGSGSSSDGGSGSGEKSGSGENSGAKKTEGKSDSGSSSTTSSGSSGSGAA